MNKWALTKVDLAWILGICAGKAIARWDRWYVPLVVGIVCGFPLWYIERRYDEKMKHSNKCPWPKDSACEALWACVECLPWYYSQPLWWRVWDKINNTFAKSWRKVQW